jgi:hypothetical protein
MFSSLLISFLASLCASALAYLTILTVKKVNSWFRKKGETASKHEVGFLLKERIKNGDYKVVTGIFNKDTNTITDYEAIRTGCIDYELSKQPDMLIYQ